MQRGQSSTDWHALFIQLRSDLALFYLGIVLFNGGIGEKLPQQSALGENQSNLQQFLVYLHDKRIVGGVTAARALRGEIGAAHWAFLDRQARRVHQALLTKPMQTLIRLLDATMKCYAT